MREPKSHGVAALVPPKPDYGWWILVVLLCSMLFEGLVIPVFGRTPNLSLFDILLPMIVMYLVVRNFLGDCLTGFRDRTVLYLAVAYVLANMLSMMVNYRDVLRSFVAIKIFVFGFLTYWVLSATIRSRLTLERATVCLVVWGVVLGIMLLYRFVMDWSSVIGPEASYEAKDQISIYGWARSNYLAAILVPILPVATGSAVIRHGVQRLMMIVAAGVIGFGLLITMSKAAILSLVLGAICATPLFYKAGLTLRHVLTLLSIIVLFFLIVPTDLVATNYDMFVYRADNPDLNRIDLWTIAWKEFVRNPVLGVGPYCIYIYNRQYAIDDLYTHNFILNALADLGLVGALPFVLLLAALVRRSYKACVSTSSDLNSRWMSISLYVGLISTLIHGLVEPTFPGREYSVVFWVCISLIMLYDQSGVRLNQSGVPLSRVGYRPDAIP